MRDINEVLGMMVPPRASEMENEDAREFVLQLSLSHIGNREIYAKYKTRLDLLKQQGKSISTVFFRVFEKNSRGEDLTNEEKSAIAQTVAALIDKHI